MILTCRLPCRWSRANFGEAFFQMQLTVGSLRVPVANQTACSATGGDT
jgi:hypothetical protein